MTIKNSSIRCFRTGETSNDEFAHFDFRRCQIDFRFAPAEFLSNPDLVNFKISMLWSMRSMIFAESKSSHMCSKQSACTFVGWSNKYSAQFMQHHKFLAISISLSFDIQILIFRLLAHVYYFFPLNITSIHFEMLDADGCLSTIFNDFISRTKMTAKDSKVN